MARSGSMIPLRTTADDPLAAPHQIGDAANWQLVTDMLADRAARAQAFGADSVLDMPFAAAVKTGTSSGSRDTWTVGYTREYTVGVWTGNFDGAPMRSIAGVSGAGPLWNRIMLHLYERRDPPAFQAPRGYARTRMCASTGSLDLRGCRSIVAEFLDRNDLRHTSNVNATASDGFDEWRARQGNLAGTLRVLFPHDGDVFEDKLAANDPARPQQQIECVAMHPAGSHVRWTIDGSRLANAPGDRAYWQVRPGKWTLSASDGRTTARVRFTVVRALGGLRKGFVIR